MTKSLSAVERANPPSRRKSCLNCIKSKRRCDLRIPTCTRCSQRHLECSYSSQNNRNIIIPVEDRRPAWVHILPQLLERDPRVPDTQSIVPVSSNSLTWVVQPPENGLGDIIPLTFDLTNASLDIVEQTPGILVRSHVKPFEFTSAAISTRLQYSIDQILVAPRQMVLENQTPWCHRHLYIDDMPSSMKDAVASCALYLAKNSINAPMISRAIEANETDLLSAPEPTTAVELLARIQALILYQIICLLDGDIVAMAMAATTSSSLEAATLAMMPYVEFYDAPIVEDGAVLELYPVTTTKEIWLSWVFQESARRTLLIAFFLLQIYRLLAGSELLPCDGSKMYVNPSWTLSAHLWNAHSVLDFATAWREKKHFDMTMANFSEVLREARGDDIETFGKMLLTAAIGIDEAKAWLNSRGGTL
ncbi:transcription factor gsfR2 [Lipomyces kononenkoae]